MIDDKTLDHEDARAAIEAIYAELKRRGKLAVIAVVDSHGETLALLRMSGALLSSVSVSTNKALTAARLNRPSAAVGARVRDREAGIDVAYYGDPRIVGFGGGFPCVVDGRAVGGIGVSGLTDAEDEELCRIGLAAIAARRA